MPITFQVDRQRRLVRFEASGELRTEEMRQALLGALGALGGETGYAVVSDHRQLVSPATPEQVREMVQILASDGGALRGSRVAMIVAQTASYGMMRMLGAYTGELGIDVGVFWNEQDAWQFLARPRD